MNDSTYSLLADLVLTTHVTFVLFVILGLILILFGGGLGWSWVRNPWFRAFHLGSIGLVVIQAWFGIICPLTKLEMHLRAQAGDATYEGAFVAHWLHQLLYYEAPPWVFTVCYTVFGLAVAASWWKVRPRSFRAKTA